MNFREIIESYSAEMIDKLCEIVSIPSVEGEPFEGKPFGLEVDRALKYTLELCDSMGLKTLNVDNYAGHAEFGEGEDTIGVVLHLDVVPAGDGWTYSPFEPVVVDGKIYGRGTTDNKGPLIAILYAIKVLKVNVGKLDKKVRIIFGTNEETRWEGIKYYLQKVEPPQFTIVPDGLFPMIFAEKGIVDIEMSNSFDDEIIKVNYFNGGNAINSVPDECKIKFSSEEEILAEIIEKLKTVNVVNGFSFNNEVKDNTIKITVKGLPAHASVPEKGMNAIAYMAKILHKILPSNSTLYNIVEFIKNKFPYSDYHGKNAGIYYEDNPSGKITCNLGTLKLENSQIKLGCNIRYPVTMDYDKLVSDFKKTVNDSKWDMAVTDHLKPVYHPLDSYEVKSLINIYRSVSGDYSSQPISFGAGTYARALPNAVTFGGQMQSDEVQPHQNDEYLTVDNLMLMTEVYAHSIYTLASNNDNKNYINKIGFKAND